MMTPTLTLLFGALFSPISGGLFRAQVAVHNATKNSSQALNSSTTNLTNATKAASDGLPVYDPQEQRYLNGLRLIPHQFQEAVYLFKNMDKDRNKELSAVEFSKGLPEEAPAAGYPAAASVGKYFYNPLAGAGSSMKASQFYRFFALAVAKPAEFAWQVGERSQLSEHFQDEKAQFLRLFITYDVDCSDGVSLSELRNGRDNKLLQAVHAASIPVSDLYKSKRETEIAEADFSDHAATGSDGFTQLSLIEFVKLGQEAKAKAFQKPAEKSHSQQVFGCCSAFFLLFIKFMML